MAYLSLYRKYRSQTFDEIVGQDHITTTLRHAIERNRIAHAYLFSGPRGTGKTSSARIFAKALNCENGPTPTPCNQCHICTSITSDSLFDVIEIDAASNRGIDDIRDLREKVRIPPSVAKFKVYIIDEVHMLTREAVNALLKTLEEPPQNVVFLMATTEPQKLLPTILSRCQRFDFRRLTEVEISTHLRNICANEGVTIDDQALGVIVKSADGSLRDAISILDQLVSFSAGNVTGADVNQVFGLVERREIGEFMQSVFDGDAARAFALFDSFFHAGKSFTLFIRLLMEYTRDLYLIRKSIRPLTEYSKDELDPMVTQARALQPTAIIAILDELARVEDRIRWETYPRVILEIMVVKLISVIAEGVPALAHSSPEIAIPDAPPARRQAPAERSAPSFPQQVPAQRAARAAERTPDAVGRTLAPVDPATAQGGQLIVNIRNSWPAILEAVKSNTMSAYFLLEQAEPVAVAGTTLVIEFAPENGFHRDQLAESHNMEVLRSVVESVSGISYEIDLRLRGAAKVYEPSAPAPKQQSAPSQVAPASPTLEIPDPEEPARIPTDIYDDPASDMPATPESVFDPSPSATPRTEPPAPAQAPQAGHLDDQPKPSGQTSLFDIFSNAFPEGKELK